MREKQSPAPLSRTCLSLHLRRGLDGGYRVCYGLGLQTARIFRRGGRRLYRAARPLGRALQKAADRLVLRHIRAFKEGFSGLGADFRKAGARLAAAWRRHPLLVIPRALTLPALAFRRYRRAVIGLANLAAPVAAALVLLFTVQYWTTRTFGLVLEVDGQVLGTIADESVYETAANMAAQRVIDTDDSFQLTQSPKLTLAVVPREEMLDESALCDEILRSAGDSIAQASGLYIDGEFEGAVESRDELQGVLDAILLSYTEGAEDVRAEFLQTTEVVEGLYPISSLLTAEDIREKLTRPAQVEKQVTVAAGDTLGAIARSNDMTLEELRALNPDVQDTDTVVVGQTLVVQREQPYLQVRVIRQLTYTETIAFETETVQDSSKYVGYEAIKTKGQDGSRQVVAEEVLVDGVRESITELSSTVIKEPVTQVKVVGTKKYPTGAGGLFIWPVPGYTNIYSPYGWRDGSFHKGIDISQSGINGKTIVAAAAGKVVEVNKTSTWGAGYGYYVVIEHAGGYKTRYAHCQSIDVNVGDTVYQGQPIAKVGNTGRSTGAHLHFEIIYNGSVVNPTSYVKGK